MSEREPLSDPEIEEYNRKAVEEGKPTYEEMLVTVREFVSELSSVTITDLSVPRTQLVEELYNVAKAVEEHEK